ncbi:MAG: NUDIX domain-containing protein [Bacteroidota bacterium]
MNFNIAVDCVIVGYDSQENRLKVLFTKRVNEPEKGQWALPGGFVKKTETFEDTAKTILLKETGLARVFLRQLKAYSLTDASSLNRIASVAYYALIKYKDVSVTDSKQPTKWYYFKELPKLPFDHGEKVLATIERIKDLVRLEPVVYHLLPKKFPLNQLQKFYEALYDMKIDNRNFRKKIQKLPYIEKLNEMEINVSHRPANLYCFNAAKYEDSLQVY